MRSAGLAEAGFAGHMYDKGRQAGRNRDLFFTTLPIAINQIPFRLSTRLLPGWLGSNQCFGEFARIGW